MIAESAIDFLQYGALGLAALMFVAFLGFAYWAFNRLMDVQARTLQAFNRIADALNTRPCLRDDRIQKNGTFKLGNEE